MEGSAASGSFPASQTNNRSMANQADESQNYQSAYSPLLQSVVGMNFQPTGHALFNQGSQVQSNIQCFNHTSQPQSKETYQNWSLIHHSDPLHSQPCQSNVAGQGLTDLWHSVDNTFWKHPQPTSQPELNETRQNHTLIHHSNSQHTGQFQSNVAGQSQTDLTNSVPSDSLVHPQPTSQPQLNETRQNHTLIHHSNSQHTGQFQSNVAGQSRTDITNSVPSDSLVHPQPTSQPQLNETRQNQTLIPHSNSQHTLQFQSDVAGQTDLTNSMQSDSLVHSQPRSQPQLNETRQNQTLIPHSTSQHTLQFQSDVAGQTDLTNSVQNDSLVHPQPTSQPQLNQGDPSQGSQQTRSRRRKAASEAERLERRRAADRKYKDKMKQKEAKTYSENENLKKKNGILAIHNRSLSDYIIQKQPNEQIPAEIRPLLHCWQKQNEKIPAQIGQLDTQKIHQPSFSAPVAGFPGNHHGEDSEEFDEDPQVSALRIQRDRLAAVARQLQQKSTSCQQQNELSEEQLNGSQFSNDVQDPPWACSSSHGVGITSSSNPTEKQYNSRALMAKILKRIGEKRKSKVTYSDFPGLDIDRRVAVGEYNFPKSLQSTVEKITNMYGDVSKNSTMPQCVDETIYILFCASIKEMDDLQLPKVTEKCIIKWSDTIKAALGINFDVGFAMDHLKDNIIPAFVGQIHCQRVHEMEEKISNLEASLNALKQDHAQECEQSKVYKNAMEKFDGKSVSSGLFM